MWSNRQRRRQRDRRVALDLAQQTADRIAARDQRLRAVGLRVNNDNTVTGEAVTDTPDAGVRLHVQFNNFPADRALAQLQQHIEQLQRQIDEGNRGVRVMVGFGRGYMDGHVGPARQTEQEQAAARLKARETLTSFLSPEQRASYEEHQYFDLIGSLGNAYRIVTDRSASGNVIWRVGGHQGGKYCAYPQGYTPDGQRIPVEDQFLGQMLQLITDETSYLDKANVFSGNYPPEHPKHADYAKMYAATGCTSELQKCPCDGCQRLLRRYRPDAVGRYARSPLWPPRPW